MGLRYLSRQQTQLSFSSANQCCRVHPLMTSRAATKDYRAAFEGQPILHNKGYAALRKIAHAWSMLQSLKEDPLRTGT